MDVQVRALALGISAGTEMLVLGGHVPESIRAAMALPTQRGSFDLPISYGYAAVGEIEAVGSGVPDDRKQTRVFSLHPHHDRFVVLESQTRSLPAHIPAARATLAANLETALNAVWDAGLVLGERAVVAGLGVVGQLVALLAKRAGASVVAFDPNPERVTLAQTLGIDAIFTSVHNAFPDKADVLFETSGSPASLEALVSVAGFEARVVVVSWYGDRGVTLPLGGRFHAHRVQIFGSQVGVIPPARRGRFDYARRFEVVSSFLEDPALDKLIAPLVPLSDAPRVYADLGRGLSVCPPHIVFDPSL